MKVNVVRAWKDPEYRKSLTPEQLASLPENPAGNSALTDQEAEQIAAGSGWPHTLTSTEAVSCCQTFVCSGCTDFKGI